MEYENEDEVDTEEARASSLCDVVHRETTVTRSQTLRLMRSVVKGVDIEIGGGGISRSSMESGEVVDQSTC